MFFLRYLERAISLHPSFLGNNITEFLTEKLYEDMEGSCNGEYYIICIMDIYNISAGKVRPGTGIAEFTILYRAILWKPFKGEAIDCIVVGVKPQGVFCEAGPLSVFVSKLVSTTCARRGRTRTSADGTVALASSIQIQR